jgi:hypothetical protein
MSIYLLCIAEIIIMFLDRALESGISYKIFTELIPKSFLTC